MLYLLIFFVIVGVTDYCVNNGIQIFLFVDIVTKILIIVGVINCFIYGTTNDGVEFLILCMAVFLHNFWKGRIFYERIERYLRDNEKKEGNE